MTDDRKQLTVRKAVICTLSIVNSYLHSYHSHSYRHLPSVNCQLLSPLISFPFLPSSVLRQLSTPISTHIIPIPTVICPPSTVNFSIHLTYAPLLRDHLDEPQNGFTGIPIQQIANISFPPGYCVWNILYYQRTVHREQYGSGHSKRY